MEKGKQITNTTFQFLIFKHIISAVLNHAPVQMSHKGDHVREPVGPPRAPPIMADVGNRKIQMGRPHYKISSQSHHLTP